MLLAFEFMDAVVAVHVMAVVVAFGVTFAYPLLGAHFMTNHPRQVPILLHAQVLIGRRLITPGATVALLTGIWVASDRDLWDQAWVHIGFGILVLLLGMAGAFFTPRERRMAEMAEREIAGGGSGDAVDWSEEFQREQKTLAIGGALASLLVLVAIFVMVTKWPG